MALRLLRLGALAQRFFLHFLATVAAPPRFLLFFLHFLGLAVPRPVGGEGAAMPVPVRFRVAEDIGGTVSPKVIPNDRSPIPVGVRLAVN